jgi:hypothetical protein
MPRFCARSMPRRAVALCSLGRLVAKVTSCCAAKGRSGTDDLVVVRDCMALGLRARAADPMTRKLGSETEIEAASKLHQEVAVDRFAGLALFSALRQTEFLSFVRSSNGCHLAHDRVLTRAANDGIAKGWIGLPL